MLLYMLLCFKYVCYRRNIQAMYDVLSLFNVLIRFMSPPSTPPPSLTHANKFWAKTRIRKTRMDFRLKIFRIPLKNRINACKPHLNGLLPLNGLMNRP